MISLLGIKMPYLPNEITTVTVTCPKNSSNLLMQKRGFDKDPAITGSVADPKKKLVTAYILFSADIRKLTMEENPGTVVY